MKASHWNLEDLWFRDGLGVQLVLLVMSLGRFKFLLRALRFDNINFRKERKLLDKLAPIQRYISIILENRQNNYVSELMTVDEMLEEFRDCCAFRYMKSKPARCGVKIFVLCCARSFYTTILKIYAESQPDRY